MVNWPSFSRIISPELTQYLSLDLDRTIRIPWNARDSCQSRSDGLGLNTKFLLPQVYEFPFFLYQYSIKPT